MVNILEEWMKEKLNISSKLKKEDIEKKQLENLNNIILHSKKSSFYKEHLKGIDKLDSLEEIKKLPFIDEDDIKNYHNKMVCISQEEIVKISTMYTSGTTGDKKRIYFSDRDIESIVDFFHNGLSQFIKPNTKTLILMPSSVENSIGDLVSKGIERIGGSSIKYGLIDSFEKTYNSLKECDYIIGMPIQVLILGRYMKYYNKSFDIKGILLSADNGSEIIFDEIKKIYNAEVFNHYGITEAGLGAAVQCNFHMRMHPRELDLYFEIIDPVTENILEDGEFGELVFTTLTREAMPIIRYKTGDITRFLKGRCNCNSPFKRMDNIVGRKNELGKFNLKDLDNKFYKLNSLIDYSIKIENEKIRMLCRFFPFDIPKEQEIKNILYELGYNSEDIELNIEIDSEFRNIHKGKRKIYF